jgi:Uma2 family endonuclease
MMETAVAPPPVATTPTATSTWTREAYRALPEDYPHYEWEDGELVEMPRPRLRHQEVIGQIYAALMSFLRANPLGKVWPEIEVDLTETETYIPDLTFLEAGHFDRIEDGLRIVGAPDLVVEVLSPATAVRDRSTKLSAYQHAGVPWYWLVEADTLLISEYKNTPDGYLLTASVPPSQTFTPNLFPGFSLNLAALMGEQPVKEDQHE